MGDVGHVDGVVVRHLASCSLHYIRIRRARVIHLNKILLYKTLVSY